MPTHHHRFVEEYNGLVGFGLDRETDEASLIVFLQKFSDDDLMETLRGRLDDGELDELFQIVSRFLRKHLSQEEYHRLFLKDTDKF